VYSKDMVDLLKEIMAVDFVVYELALFLNTHPMTEGPWKTTIILQEGLRSLEPCTKKNTDL
jgi:hypothetical protein